MNTKKIPLFTMLLAGSVACIVTYLYHYSLHDMLVVLLIVLILFLILGLIIKKIFDKFEISTDKPVDDEGEVVEKLSDENGEGLDAESPDLEDQMSMEDEGEQQEEEQGV